MYVQRLVMHHGLKFIANALERYIGKSSSWTAALISRGSTYATQKEVALHSNDRAAHLLPMSSVRQRSLSGRYVNFITPKGRRRRRRRKPRERTGGNKAETATAYSFHVLLGGPQRDRLSRELTSGMCRNNVAVISLKRSRWDCSEAK